MQDVGKRLNSWGALASGWTLCPLYQAPVISCWNCVSIFEVHTSEETSSSICSPLVEVSVNMVEVENMLEVEENLRGLEVEVSAVLCLLLCYSNALLSSKKKKTEALQKTVLCRLGLLHTLKSRKQQLNLLSCWAHPGVRFCSRVQFSWRRRRKLLPRSKKTNCETAQNSCEFMCGHVCPEVLRFPPELLNWSTSLFDFMLNQGVT